MTMHNQLEKYLNEIAAHLSRLPTKHRNEELREMRQHLQNAVLAHCEKGHREEDAVQTAIEQFGMPQELANRIIHSWQRGRRLDRRSLWGAFLCAFSLPFLVYPLLICLMRTTFTLPPNPSTTDAVALCLRVTAGILIGSLTGLFFPKRAVPGVLLNSLIWLAIGPGQLIFRWWHGDMNTAHLVSTLPTISGMDVESIVTVTLAAWAASRWRKTHSGHTSPAS